jgi:hypothetical protein
MAQKKAIDAAVTLYRQPGLARRMEKSLLPEGISEVLRIVAGASDIPQEICDEHGMPPSELYLACVFFMQTVVFHQRASDLRMLGFSSTPTLKQLKDHKRYLLMWLHPDRNRNSWESKLFERAFAAIERMERVLAKGDSNAVPEIPAKNSRRRHRTAWRVSQSRQRSAIAWKQIFRRALKKIAIVAAVLAVGSSLFFVFTTSHGRVLAIEQVQN